jgi:hypothetical protein
MMVFRKASILRAAAILSSMGMSASNSCTKKKGRWETGVLSAELIRQRQAQLDGPERGSSSSL